MWITAARRGHTLHCGGVHEPFSQLPRIFRWQDALAAGATQHRVRAAVAGGTISRLSPGIYLRPEALEEGEPWELVRAQHLRRCAELLTRHPGHAASHQTAAALHGLDLAIHPESDVHLTAVERVARTQRYAGAHLHHADSVPTATVTVDGIRVTTIARTLADVLRTSKPPHSVAVLDGALREGRVTAAEVKSELDRQVRWKGRPRALDAFGLRDARRETWLESYSFVRLYGLGLPLPLPQVEILDEGFHLVGRVDGLIEETGTFLEADGADKYLIPARTAGVSDDESIQQSTEAQSIRHNRLVGLGLTGARWTTEEAVHAPEMVIRRIREAMRAGDPARFRGWLRYGGRILSLGEAARQSRAPASPPHRAW